VVQHIAEYARISRTSFCIAKSSRLSYERTWGLTEGNIFQGELSLEQLFSCGRWLDGAIPVADQEFVYVRIGDASGRGIMARRTAGGARNSERRGDKHMAETRDVIIVGGGHNGLVAAFYLAKADSNRWCSKGAQVGSGHTEEYIPVSAARRSAQYGPLRADIVRDMQLERHGLKLTTPDVGTFLCCRTAGRSCSTLTPRRLRGDRSVVAERCDRVRGLWSGARQDRK